MHTRFALRTSYGLLLICLSVVLGSHRPPPPPTPVPVVKWAALARVLESSADTVYVVNFWATWCRPCVMELPAFEQNARQFRDRPVRFLLVSLDFREELKKKVVPFVQKRQLMSEVWLLDEPDYNAWIDKVDKSWEGDIPATLIFHGSRKKRTFLAQELTAEALEKQIIQHLN